MTFVIPVKRRDATSLGELVTGDRIPVMFLSAVVGRNMLINCGVPINQRVFAGGALAAGVYGYDRWKAGSGGCNITINSTTGVFSHVSGPLQQIVELPENAWGFPLTISVEDPTGNISVSVGGSTGVITAGSGRRGITLTPSGSGNLTTQLTATGVTYSRLQLERGSEPTEFDARPAATELSLCQRYFEKSYSLNVAPGSASPGGRLGEFIGVDRTRANALMIRFLATKRGTAAVSVYASETGAINNISQDDGGNKAVDSISNQSDGGFQVVWTNSTGRYGASFHYTADAEL